ncbi:MAG TPA: hypothetical protein VHI93_02310 [Candidatus Thermoplasmatota archaeon]|nr:hypothetical protein [Candidatus Thermoplasmatota archaeon]
MKPEAACDHGGDLASLAASLKQLVTLHRLTVLALIVLAGADQVLRRLPG